MIARLCGEVVEKGDDHAILDVGGVGYRVFLSAVALGALPPGERVTLRTFTHVRDDAIQLFGFATEDEEMVFQQLIGVKNVGPRAAQNILSGIAPHELAGAVAGGDVARLTKVPGVGKKTAERLVLELKEKLQGLARTAAPRNAARSGGTLEQLARALEGLGYRSQQAEQAVEAMRERAEGRALDELLREALQMMRA
jgi:Holliday junction DNA helicase RuvA